MEGAIAGDPFKNPENRRRDFGLIDSLDSLGRALQGSMTIRSGEMLPHLVLTT